MKFPKSTKERSFKGLKLFWTLFGALLLAPLFTNGQNFFKENKNKTISAELSLGAGTFFAAPRPFTDSLVSKMMPVLSLGIAKRLASHLSIKSQLSLQSFATTEYSNSEQSTRPLYQGISYAFEMMPIFNLLPTYHHLYRPKVDVNLGIGLGYLATYRAEKFTFQDKEYSFTFLEHSPYVPIRTALSFRLDDRSDLAVEGVFFRTWLDKYSSSPNFTLLGNHFAQANLVYRWWIK
jgi:hypothetical protein